ncbi:hypothetical protein SLT36_23545 [Aminobacter sp. BA135]|uniref:DUF3800 domain-containing protein n=1 Tax=Aminobacter sp. BA135 TaxID=537596 RepID=UPI003D792BAE
MIHAYFDESAEEKVGHGVLTVAGYIFEEDGLRGLEGEWAKLLETYRLPYFHMTECNADDPLSSENVFSHLTKPERIEAAKGAIAIARKHPLHGAAYVVWQEEYREILEDGGFGCDAYSFLLWSALLQVSKWCITNRPQSLSLYFEQGYKTQSRANDLLQFAIQDEAVWRNKGRPPVIRHSFFDKDASYPGQAADLLAWHVRKGNANVSSGKPVRRDSTALFEDRSIKTVHYPRERLVEIRDHFILKGGTLERAAQILFTPIDPFLADEGAGSR